LYACRGGPLNKDNYLQIVRDTLGHHAQHFSTEKLDLVFRTLDNNRDGFLDESELERVSQDILNHGCDTLSLNRRMNYHLRAHA
jgi:Ca2+-binding EF-hand superfamily protein